MTKDGLQYKDLREGSGRSPQDGDTCVIDWQGYTIGYYGRIFESRNKPKGSSFEGNDRAFLRLKLGRDNIVPGVEEALRGMREGDQRLTESACVCCACQLSRHVNALLTRSLLKCHTLHLNK